MKVHWSFSSRIGAAWGQCQQGQFIPISHLQSVVSETLLIDGPFIESKECCAPIACLLGAHDSLETPKVAPPLRDSTSSRELVEDYCVRKVVGL